MKCVLNCLYQEYSELSQGVADEWNIFEVCYIEWI
jgi:hypothetical protein